MRDDVWIEELKVKLPSVTKGLRSNIGIGYSVAKGNSKNRKTVGATLRAIRERLLSSEDD